MQQQPGSFTMHVSERTMRRVQIAMTAMQATEQTAKAAADAAQSMTDQARRSLDEALGAVCDAHDEQLPTEYTLSVRPKDGTITISDNNQQGMPVSFPTAPDLAVVANGQDHASALVEASEGVQT